MQSMVCRAPIRLRVRVCAFVFLSSVQCLVHLAETLSRHTRFFNGPQSRKKVPMMVC